MKILISVQYFDPPRGGAEISLQTLARKLSEKHDVYVLQSGIKDKVKHFDKIKLIVNKVPIYDKIYLFPINFQADSWKKILERKVNNIKPDLILTQLNFAPPTIDIASKYNIPSVFFIRSYEHFCPIGFINGTNCNKQCKNCLTVQNKLRFSNIDRWLEWNRKAIKSSDLVIANSNFVANLTQESYGIKPSVMYPSIDTNRYEYECTNKYRQYITMIKPTKIKGVDTFLNIAKSMPDKKFLVAGTSKILLIRKLIDKTDNIKFLGWTNNIENVYSKTRILLSPVKWPEPFGRAIIEAGLNGIPTIASNKGGIPEAVGDGGILIDDINDINEWVKVIYSLDNEDLYYKLSKNAKAHSEEFNFSMNFNHFKNSVKEYLNIYL